MILVDNLYNQNPITEEDLHFLTLFSNQAGMAIENARLYRHLEEMHEELKETQALLLQHEKMAALGELSDTIAHEIRNPLVSIGGFARRLYRAVTEEVPEKRYAQTIMVEVARIEKILDDVTQYTHKDSPVSKACDLQEILESSLSMISEEYKTERLQMVKEFAPDLPKSHGRRSTAETGLFQPVHQCLSGDEWKWDSVCSSLLLLPEMERLIFEWK